MTSSLSNRLTDFKSSSGPNSMGINGADRFCAGLFVNAAAIEASPHPRSQHYQSEAVRHIGKNHSGYTPFVVCTCSSLLGSSATKR